MSDLENASLLFKGAFDAYVETLGESSNSAASVVRAMNDLQVAVGIFVDASIRAAGWGNPFISPNEENDKTQHGSAAGAVRLEASYLLQVTNEHTFREFVLDRAHRAGVLPHDEIDTPVSQIHELFAVDGWDPFSYSRPDLKVIESRWSASPESR